MKYFWNWEPEITSDKKSRACSPCKKVWFKFMGLHDGYHNFDCPVSAHAKQLKTMQTVLRTSAFSNKTGEDLENMRFDHKLCFTVWLFFSFLTFSYIPLCAALLIVLCASSLYSGLHETMREKKSSVLWNKPQRQLRLSAITLNCPKYKWDQQSFLTHLQQCENGSDWQIHTTEIVRLQDTPQTNWAKSFTAWNSHMHFSTLRGLSRPSVMSAVSQGKVQLLVLSVDDNTLWFDFTLDVHFYGHQAQMAWHIIHSTEQFYSIHV